MIEAIGVWRGKGSPVPPDYGKAVTGCRTSTFPSASYTFPRDFSVGSQTVPVAEGATNEEVLDSCSRAVIGKNIGVAAEATFVNGAGQVVEIGFAYLAKQGPPDGKRIAQMFWDESEARAALLGATVKAVSCIIS